MDEDKKTGLWAGMSQWIAHPFNTQGSALNWVLFFGLAIVAVWFWSHVVMTLTDDI